MLHVILLILKILGIILLVTIGLVLFAVYAVFFAALPYRIEIKKKEDTQVLAFVSWFFRIITVRFRVDSRNGWEPEFQMRLFGYPLWQNVEEESRWKRLRRFRKWIKRKFMSRWRHETAEKPEADTDQADSGEWKKTREKSSANPMRESAQEESTGIHREQEDTAQKEAADAVSVPGLQDTKAASGSNKEEAGPEKKKSRTSSAGGEKKAQKKSVFQKIRHMLHGIHDKIKRIRKKTAGIGDIIQKLRSRKDALVDMWNREESRLARETIIGEIRYMWKKLRPKKIRGRIRFGFADPARTGLCMGAAGMLCAWYPQKLEIVPDFDREILEGNILIRGKARIYVFVRVLWRIYINEDIRKMYRYLRE